MPTEAEANARSLVIAEYNQLYKLREYEDTFRASGVPLPDSWLSVPLRYLLSAAEKAWAAVLVCVNHCQATPAEFDKIGEWLARRHQFLQSAVRTQTALPSDILLLGLVSLHSNLPTLLHLCCPADVCL